MVSFAGLGFQLGEGLEELAHVGWAAAREKLLLDAAAVAEKSNAIA
jgi:hypothetical protein